MTNYTGNELPNLEILKICRVACVHPGFVATALGKESWGDGNEKMENIIKGIYY